MRQTVSTLLELAGFGLLVVAGWLVAPALGVAVCGVVLFLVGLTLEGDS